MWGKGWLVLAAKKSGRVTCKTTKDYISCINDIPLTRNIAR